MGERRKRRSLWDKEAEAPHFSGTSENNYWTGKERHSSHDSGQYHEFSGSESFRAPNFRDKSRQPSLEYIEEDPVAPMSGRFNRSREYPPERKELGGENKYYQRMSPEFKYSHSLGNDQSHSQRYPGRGRSRSRSRSRGRSRSRSLSRGREKERVRVRSRSRSRDDDMARGQRSWRNRADHGHISRHSYSSRGSRSELRDDVSDPYQGEDEQFQNRSRGAIPCKDFIKGNCRWGDTCRFSHHSASEETSGRGTRYSSSDKDGEQQPYRSGMPLCKYFAAGKCDRNNCRFSHEDSRFNSLEGRERKVGDDDSFRNKGNKREREPTWMDTTRITDNVKRSGWNESIVRVTNNHSDNTNERNGNRWGHSLGNENVNQGIRERADNLIDRNNLHSPPARSGSYSGDLGISGSINEENMANKQEVLMLPDSQLQIQDRNLKAQGPNILEVDQQFSVEALQNVSQISHIQQQGYGVVENNPMSSFRSDVFDEVKDFRNVVDPISFSGQNLSQNGENVFPGHSSLPMKADSGQNIPYPNPADLVANLKLLSQVQNHRNAIQMARMLETRVPQLFPDLATSEHSAPFTNSLVPVPGQQGALVETDYMNFNPVSVSHDPVNPMENDRGTNEQKNHTEQGNQMQAERLSPFSIAGVEPDKSKVDHSERSKLKEETVLANSEVGEAKGAVGEESKGVTETLEGHGKAEESNANKDEKGMRLFKIALVEFVKDILKPTWKEGRMSREVHKTIVKKVVDKVISTIQVDHIPKTQEKAEQYLSFSKPKIAKLVQAYVGRSLKSDS